MILIGTARSGPHTHTDMPILTLGHTIGREYVSAHTEQFPLSSGGIITATLGELSTTGITITIIVLILTTIVTTQIITGVVGGLLTTGILNITIATTKGIGAIEITQDSIMAAKRVSIMAGAM